MFIIRLLPPLCYRFDLLTYFWINRILLLGEGWRGNANANPTVATIERVFIVSSVKSCRSIGVCQANLPVAGITYIDRYVAALLSDIVMT